MVSAGWDLRGLEAEPYRYRGDKTEAHTRSLVAVGEEVPSCGETHLWGEVQICSSRGSQVVRWDRTLPRADLATTVSRRCKTW